MDKLSIFLRTGGEESLLWYYTPKLDYWEAGQTLLPKNDNFQVKPCVQALRNEALKIIVLCY